MKVNSNRIILFLCYLLWFIISYYSLAASFSTKTGNSATYNDGRIYLLLELICLAYLVFTHVLCYNKIILCSTIIMLCQIIGLFLAGSSGIAVLCMRISCWLILLITAFQYMYRNDKDITYFANLCSIGLIILSLYACTQQMNIRVDTSSDAGLNELYIILMALPFLYIISNKYIRYFGSAVVLIMVLLSLKATALLAVISGILVYYIINSILNGKRTSKWLLVSLVLAVLLYLYLESINDFLMTRLNVSWLSKIELSGSSGGSGRTDIWINTVRLQMDSSIFEWIFGHGYNTVVNQLDFSAHNDFLESLYDFGLIGFTAYILLYGFLIRQVKLMLDLKHKYAPALGMSICMFFVISMFSHLLIVPSLLVNCGLFWAVCMASYEVELDEKFDLSER